MRDTEPAESPTRTESLVPLTLAAHRRRRRKRYTNSSVIRMFETPPIHPAIFEFKRSVSVALINAANEARRFHLLQVAHSADSRQVPFFLFAHFLLSNVHDLPHAELLYNQLQDRGLSVFFDAKCLRFGEPWEPQITAALFSSAVIVLLISQAAVEGTICHDLLYFDQNCIQISLVCSSNEGSSADATSARLPPP